MSSLYPVERTALEQERNEILHQLENWLEAPLIVLGFAWLGLFLVEVIWGLNPWFDAVGTTIWIVFLLDFGLKLALAPRKRLYLKQNWLTLLSLLLPALRIFRVAYLVRSLQSIRAVRGLNLLRIMTRTNRVMRALSASVGRRRFSYVVALTAIVTLSGAAGMYVFEQEITDPNALHDYGTALWWTAMVMTTMGSDYFPKTPEGRVLCFLLSLYAFAMFGYVTATLATFFMGRDAEDSEAEVAGEKSIQALQAEIAALRAELQAFVQKTREE